MVYKTINFLRLKWEDVILYAKNPTCFKVLTKSMDFQEILNFRSMVVNIGWQNEEYKPDEEMRASITYFPRFWTPTPK